MPSTSCTCLEADSAGGCRQAFHKTYSGDEASRQWFLEESFLLLFFKVTNMLLRQENPAIMSPIIHLIQDVEIPIIDERTENPAELSVLDKRIFDAGFIGFILGAICVSVLFILL